MPGQAAFPCRARAGPWAELKAQARARVRAVPGTGTGPCGLGRALSGRARVSPAGLAHLENFTCMERRHLCARWIVRRVMTILSLSACSCVRYLSCLSKLYY